MAKDWCNEKDPNNKKVLDFIRAYRADAEKIAKKLDVSVELILGLSGTESGYGTSNIARKAKNFFGLTAGASGNIGVFTTSQNVKVAKFKNFISSGLSFVAHFGKLVHGKKTPEGFVNALVPKFNTADPKTNGNPHFRKDTLLGIIAIANRLKCENTSSSTHKCGARCKNFKEYGLCDRRTKGRRCWQHS